MILADKIILLRKKREWSQEQLAEQLGISRQSVSKWESGASIPDLDKILKMSTLFQVSTDYLLKDEIEEYESPKKEEGTEEETEKEICHSVSLEEASTFMEISRKSAKKFAIASMLCVFSVIPLILLGGFWEYGKLSISEDAAGGIGTIIFFLFIIVAVAIFILEGMKLAKYEYLEKELISLQYGVEGSVNRNKEAFAESYRKSIAIGTVLCILGIIPLLGAAALSAGDLGYVCCIGVLLFFIGIGVYFFVWSGCIQDSFQKLLQEEEYSREHKSIKKRTRWFAGAYWCIVTAIYLAISLPSNSWDTSWILWPVAAVLFAALQLIVNAVAAKK